tara:strand:- start:12948 stop:13598 length:651 start_codon:yes stop_codon:yes gene_type:complete
MVVQRTLIRRYIGELLRSGIDESYPAVDVGGRVYVNRPSPRLLDTIPCVLVHPGNEGLAPNIGDTYTVDEYKRTFTMYVDIMVEEQLRPDEDPDFNQEAEDVLDLLGKQAERLLIRDNTLSRKMPGFDPNTTEEDDEISLCGGLTITDVSPYNIDTEGDREILTQRIVLSIPYYTEENSNRKLPDFLYYKVDTIRVNSDETTVNRVLLSAEGETQS